MRMFQLHRDTDISGVSGTGVVAEGVEFSDGHVVFTWVAGPHASTVSVPGGVAALLAVHGHGGSTRVVWVSAPAPRDLANITCRHCGNEGPPGADHNCPCPFSDESCLMHP